VAVTELELTRAPNDRRLYRIDEVGSVRLEGFFSRTAIAEAGGRSWHFGRRGFWQRDLEAADETGAVVGEFLPRSIRRGGALRWDGRELTVQAVSPLRERYVLGEGDRDLALLDGKGWGRRPVKITLADPSAIDPGLLLFAAFVVHQLAVNAGSGAAASSVAATGATTG
jgi:hypothetical protein